MPDPWLRFYPKIMKSEIMACHANTFKVFFVFLSLAKWREEMGLKRGQLRTTRRQIAHISHMSENSVRGTISNLKKLGMITVEGTKLGTGGWSVITVLNYDKYQYGGTVEGTITGTVEGTNGGDRRGDQQRRCRSIDVKTLRLELKNCIKTESEILEEITASTSNFDAQKILIKAVFDEASRGPITPRYVAPDPPALEDCISPAEVSRLIDKTLGRRF